MKITHHFRRYYCNNRNTRNKETVILYDNSPSNLWNHVHTTEVNPVFVLRMAFSIKAREHSNTRINFTTTTGACCNLSRDCRAEEKAHSKIQDSKHRIGGFAYIGHSLLVQLHNVFDLAPETRRNNFSRKMDSIRSYEVLV